MILSILIFVTHLRGINNRRCSIEKLLTVWNTNILFYRFTHNSCTENLFSAGWKNITKQTNIVYQMIIQKVSKSVKSLYFGPCCWSRSSLFNTTQLHSSLFYTFSFSPHCQQLLHFLFPFSSLNVLSWWSVWCLHAALLPICLYLFKYPYHHFSAALPLLSLHQAFRYIFTQQIWDLALFLSPHSPPLLSPSLFCPLPKTTLRIFFPLFELCMMWRSDALSQRESIIL